MQKLTQKFAEHSTHKASCHCGAVELEVVLSEGVSKPRHCNCSICRRRGVIAVSVDLANLKILKGEECLTLYQFNSMVAKHYFCSVCGVYTHHQRRSDPNEYSINIDCLNGMENPFALEPVAVFDGINHPQDK